MNSADHSCMDTDGNKPARMSVVMMRMMNDFSIAAKVRVAVESFGKWLVACKRAGTRECGFFGLLNIRCRWTTVSSVSCRKKRIRKGKATYKTVNGLMMGLLENYKQEYDAGALSPACSWNIGQMGKR